MKANEWRKHSLSWSMPWRTSQKTKATSRHRHKWSSQVTLRTTVSPQQQEEMHSTVVDDQRTNICGRRSVWCSFWFCSRAFASVQSAAEEKLIELMGRVGPPSLHGIPTSGVSFFAGQCNEKRRFPSGLLSDKFESHAWVRPHEQALGQVVEWPLARVSQSVHVLPGCQLQTTGAFSGTSFEDCLFRLLEPPRDGLHERNARVETHCVVGAWASCWAFFPTFPTTKN